MPAAARNALPLAAYSSYRRSRRAGSVKLAGALTRHVYQGNRHVGKKAEIAVDGMVRYRRQERLHVSKLDEKSGHPRS
ncbi:ubiquinol-cytochrome C chaperone family protein [Paraburkholderia metrosideri]|uniref:ubiquinol-cytochrome C chaperone family protein n=1 Tax=Paraburkholderia metrosideri TaxID=580937 RepID=UPI0038B354C2